MCYSENAKKDAAMPKTKKKQIDKRQTVLYGIIAILAVLCVVLIFALAQKVNTDSEKLSPSISLGSMQYDFSSGKAVKRDDASVTVLKAFLEADSVREGCSVTAPAYEHVVAYTKDETQVFLRYGCGAADSPMFAVKTNDTWKELSPTNHFDGFGVPDCNYLADNSISKEIAPVCVTGDEKETPVYTVR